MALPWVGEAGFGGAGFIVYPEPGLDAPAFACDR